MADEKKIIDLDRLKDYAKGTHAKEVNDAYVYHGMGYIAPVTDTFTCCLFDSLYSDTGHSFNFTINAATHKVVFDGVTYNNVPVSPCILGETDDPEHATTFWQMGDPNYVAYPFYAYWCRTSTAWTWVCVKPSEETHTIKIDNSIVLEVAVKRGDDPKNKRWSSPKLIKMSKVYHVGEFVDLNFDSTDYHIEVIADGLIGNLNMYNSSYPDNGLPFYIDQNLPGGMYIYTEYGTHTIKYEGIVKLNSSMMPTNVGYASKVDSVFSGAFSHDRMEGTEVGDFSVAMGRQCTATTGHSIALGTRAQATGDGAVAIGHGVLASGAHAFAEGQSTVASGAQAHAEGANCTASGTDSHAEGQQTKATKNFTHAEGDRTTAASACQHVQGKFNVVDSADTYADIIGWGAAAAYPANIEATTVTGDKKLAGDVYVHANSNSTGGELIRRPSEMGLPVYDSTKKYQKNEACYVPYAAGETYGDKWYKWGDDNMTSAAGAFDSSANWIEIKFGEGYLTAHNPTGTGSLSINANGTPPFGAAAIGSKSQATKEGAVGAGKSARAKGYASFAANEGTIAEGSGSAAFGYYSKATAGHSFAVGNYATASGEGSIAMGHTGNASYPTKAEGVGSVAIGYMAQVSDSYAVAMGTNCQTDGMGATAIGNHAIVSDGATSSIALGDRVVTVSPYQMARGQGNVEDTEKKYADILGWGLRGDDPDTAEVESNALVERRNIEATTTTGDKRLKNEIYVHCEYDSSGGVNICDTVKVTKSELDTLIADSKLIPGLIYVITDYTYTVPTGSTLITSANKKFDIALHSISKNTLSNEGTALPHNGETGLSGRDLSKWKITYDVATHTVTSLTDENNCTAPYDHINVLFKRWATMDTAENTSSFYQLTGNYGYATDMYKGQTLNATWPWIQGGKLTVGTTFAATNTFGTGCKNITVALGGTASTDFLPNITFGDYCADITIGSSCSNMTFTSGCSGITVGKKCSNIIINPYCQRITFGNGCSGFILRNCYNVSFGDFCEGIVAMTLASTFGERCSDIELYGVLPTVSNAIQCPAGLVFAGSNFDIYLAGFVRRCQFNAGAAQVWVDTRKTPKEADGSTGADNYNWFKQATFESGFHMRPGKEDAGAQGAILALNDPLFVNSKCGNKRIYQDSNNEYICAWYEGITLKGAKGTLQTSAASNTWTAL